MRSTKYLETLSDKSLDELQTELVNSKRELFNLRFQNATNQLDNTARITEVRKNIARIHTVITLRSKQPVKRLSRAKRLEAKSKVKS